jgi:hypothetical protein
LTATLTTATYNNVKVIQQQQQKQQKQEQQHKGQ